MFLIVKGHRKGTFVQSCFNSGRIDQLLDSES